MIIIHRPLRFVPEDGLLKHLGLNDLEFRETTIMEHCIYPEDKSINIGYYNENIIICEDYLLTSSLEVTDDPMGLAGYEAVLTSLFPGSEILTVACHASVNYHLYSLVKNGQKLRFKRVIASSPILEYGERLAEEEVIYADSRVIEGRRLFDSRWKNNHHHHTITEDQLMEDFAFGVAKRHLGVKISTEETEALMVATPFRKFVKTPPRPLKQARTLRSWWKFW
ncbi:MAG TPA: hypothetical protein VGM31_03985 [Puia sp.]|jgi:hypothetical protein